MNEEQQEIQSAWQDYNRSVMVSNIRIGCFLGFFLMPAGFTLDLMVYRDAATDFLEFRLFCSLLIAVFYASLFTPFGKKFYSLQGLILFSFPTYFMCLMILVMEGPVSPYYAGLNLVYLVMGLVLNWSLIESIIGVVIVVSMYLAACKIHIDIYGPDTTVNQLGLFGNNLYFLTLTGIIVSTGNFFKSRLRFSEFKLRFQLDQKKKELEISNDKLVELNSVKDRFFANISHELRTPLTLLLAPLETLLFRYQGHMDPEAKKMLRGMQANAMRLLKLINDLLDLVRLESGRLEVRKDPVDLNLFVKSIYAAAHQVADDKRINLTCEAEEGLGIVVADRDKLEKIFLNLVFNALKFTPANGSVELRVRLLDDRLEFRVSDTGIGIPQRSLPHIFDRFWQADGSNKRKFQGVGIGLSLVKELTEIQDGTVRVESVEQQGTTFIVTLPHVEADNTAFGAGEARADLPAETDHKPGMQSQEWISGLYRRAELFPALMSEREDASPAPLEGPAPDVIAPANGSRIRILIADDEPQMRRFLESQLSQHYIVVTAGDGQEAVERALETRPNLILLDLMMPRKDGIQACKELRHHEATANTPVILLTARADEEAKLDALSSGANDFLSKPFSTAELYVRIKNLLDSSRFQRDVEEKNVELEHTIHQLKDTESQLVQTEKLASLGRLSAGIIHEINNPLNFTSTGMFLLKRKAESLPEAERGDFEEILTDMDDGLQRVKDIVADLRTFTHPGNDSLKEVNLGDAVKTACRMLSNQISEEVGIVHEVPEEFIVKANAGRLVQVIINLIQNSVDALKENRPESDSPTIWIRCTSDEKRRALLIRDNGPGIASGTLENIFDPFFTTKEVGSGMGLGLSICYRIMESFGGKIGVTTRPGEFCEMSLDFPAEAPVPQTSAA